MSQGGDEISESQNRSQLGDFVTRQASPTRCHAPHELNAQRRKSVQIQITSPSTIYQREFRHTQVLLRIVRVGSGLFLPASSCHAFEVTDGDCW